MGKVLPARIPDGRSCCVLDIEKHAILVSASTPKRSRSDAANSCHCHHPTPASANTICSRYAPGKNGNVQSWRRKPAASGRKTPRVHKKVYGGGKQRAAGAQERGKTGTEKIAASARTRRWSGCWPLQRFDVK